MNQNGYLRHNTSLHHITSNYTLQFTISYNTLVYEFLSSHFISFHLISYYLVSFNVILPNLSLSPQRTVHDIQSQEVSVTAQYKILISMQFKQHSFLLHSPSHSPSIHPLIDSSLSQSINLSLCPCILTFIICSSKIQQNQSCSLPFFS